MWNKVVGNYKTSNLVTDLLIGAHDNIAYSFKVEENSNIIYIANRFSILTYPGDMIADIVEITQWKKEN